MKLLCALSLKLTTADVRHLSCRDAIENIKTDNTIIFLNPENKRRDVDTFKIIPLHYVKHVAYQYIENVSKVFTNRYVSVITLMQFKHYAYGWVSNHFVSSK